MICVTTHYVFAGGLGKKPSVFNCVKTVIEHLVLIWNTPWLVVIQLYSSHVCFPAEIELNQTSHKMAAFNCWHDFKVRISYGSWKHFGGWNFVSEKKKGELFWTLLLHERDFHLPVLRVCHERYTLNTGKWKKKLDTVLDWQPNSMFLRPEEHDH